MWHEIKRFFLYGDIYQLTSGPIIMTGVLVYLYKHTCHVHKCLRYGRHSVEGTAYVVCRKHHPATPDLVTPKHIEKAWRASQQSDSDPTEETGITTTSDPSGW